MENNMKENNDRRLDLVDFRSVTRKDSIEGYRIIKVLGEINTDMAFNFKSEKYGRGKSANHLVDTYSEIAHICICKLMFVADYLGANAIINYSMKIDGNNRFMQGTAVIIEKIEENEDMEGSFSKKYF